MLEKPKVSSPLLLDINIKVQSSSPQSHRSDSLSDGQDSVFSIHSRAVSQHGEISALMHESPTVGLHNKKSKRFEAYNRVLSTSGGGNLPTEMKVGKHEKFNILLTKESHDELDYFQKMELA